MRISIFGLGYVGTVCSACLASDGHQVIGVDVSQTKVDLVNRGLSPIIEADVGPRLARAVAERRLRATSDARAAVLASELTMICVGTPSQSNGSLDLDRVRAACEQIGAALGEKDGYHVVVVRSTMLPGSMRDVVLPTLEAASGRKVGCDFGLCINPEFMREGTAVWDFRHPPKTVIGEIDQRSGDALLELYVGIEAPVVRTRIEIAEMVKYTDNAWHAMKIAFANEVGNISKALGVDGQAVMEIFCKDTKLNLSSCYLQPGFAFGGSCLPKDMRALIYKGRTLDLELPLLSSVLQSNRLQVEKGIRMVLDKGHRRVGVLGISFKAGTDDLRESPLVDLIEHLLGKGCELKVYDRNVRLAALMGANRDFIMNRIPHIAALLVADMTQVVQFADTLVIGNGDPEFTEALEHVRPGQAVVDLVRINGASGGENYDGICW
jgi:GDP-mannose 6-dehydrogenase